ncbi:MAG: SdrD B-like domain-containing protein [Anaerolineales bacterium]
MSSPSRRKVVVVTTLTFVGFVVAACSMQAPQTSPQATATPFVFPTATQPAATGSVTGMVWLDQCSPSADDSAELPAGCVETATGDGMRAEGILSAGESGIAGLSVRLGEGSCPASGLATATTDDQGGYRFDDLQAGTYCLSVESNAEPNAVALGMGEWTFPHMEAPGPVAQQSVTLGAAASLDGVNFGWGSQPAVEPTPEATATPTAEPAGSATPAGSPTSTVAPTATVDASDPKAGLGDPIFQDDLNSAANWTLYSNDQVEFTLGNGYLGMKALKADFTDWWTLTGPEIEDFYVEIVGGLKDCAGRDEFGLAVRSSKPDDAWVGYLFAVTCDGRYQLRIWDGEGVTKLTPLTSSNFISAGSNQEHRIGLRAEGDRLTMYVDGHQLGEVNDPTYETGLVGVFIGSGTTPGVEGSIDSLKLWEVP